MPRASPPDNAFVSRRDRPEHQQRRAGTGRQITSREFGVLGRHTGARLQQTTKDSQGFDDLDQAWKSDDDDQENAGAAQNRSSLFPESPLSMSTAQNDPEPEPEIAAKRLEFSADQIEDAPEDVPDTPSPSPSEAESETEEELQPQRLPPPAKPKSSSNAASRAKTNRGKDSANVKKAVRNEKSKSPLEAITKRSKKGTAKDTGTKKKRKPSEKIRRSPDNIVENEENEEPVQESLEDTRSFSEEESTEGASSAEVAKPARKTQPKASMGRKAAPAKKKRRQTLLIIDEALQSGLIDNDIIVVEDDKVVRRSQRARCKPVAFFECEQPNYIRGPGGLFSLDREKTVIKHVPTPPPPPARRIRQKRRRPKSWDESSDDEEELLPLFGETKVIGPNGKQRRQIVAVRASDHPVVKVATKPPSGVKAQSKDLTPTICRFEGLDGLVSGIVEVPASGTKYPEIASRTEVFFVASCERNSLLVKINNNEFMLSKGDTFMVPENNTYSIENASGRKQAQLFFSTSRD